MAKKVNPSAYIWSGAIASNAPRKGSWILRQTIADGVYKPWRGHCTTARRARTRAWQKQTANQIIRATLKSQLRRDLVVD